MSLIVLIKGGEASESIQPKLSWSRVKTRSIFGPVLQRGHWRAEPWICPTFVAKIEINSGLLSSASVRQSVHQPFRKNSFRIQTVTKPYSAVWLEWFWERDCLVLKPHLTNTLAVSSDPFEKAGPVQFFTFLLRLLTSFQAMANKGGTIYMFSTFFVFTAERL